MLNPLNGGGGGYTAVVAVLVGGRGGPRFMSGFQAVLPLVRSMAATAVLPAPLVHLAALPQTDTVQAAILHTDVRRVVLSAVAGVVHAGD